MLMWHWSWRVFFIHHLGNMDSSSAQDVIKPAPFIPLCLGKGIRSFAESLAVLGITSLVRL